MEIHQFTLDKMSSLLNERINWVGLFRLLKGLSRMLGNSQVRFLGSKSREALSYPVCGEREQIVEKKPDVERVKAVRSI